MLTDNPATVFEDAGNEYSSFGFDEELAEPTDQPTSAGGAAVPRKKKKKKTKKPSADGALNGSGARAASMVPPSPITVWEEPGGGFDGLN